MDEEPARDWKKEGAALRKGMARLGYARSVEKSFSVNSLPLSWIEFKKAKATTIYAGGRCGSDAASRALSELYADAARDIIEGSACGGPGGCGSVEEFLLRLSVRD